MQRSEDGHGIDVVAGYIEPHARLQTSALVNGLECLPNLVSEYKGITLSEFNLDAALARHPQLILVDELVHTMPLYRMSCFQHSIGFADSCGIAKKDFQMSSV